MSTQVQYRRGSNVQVAAFTGALGELVIDTTNKVVVVNDGSTVGGFPQVGLTASQTITNKIYNGTSLSVTGNVTAAGATINGDLSVTGNATLSGNILGDRVVNGTTSFEIQTANGNANVSVAGTSNVVVFANNGIFVTGVASVSGNVTGGNILTGGLISATSTITSAANVIGGNISTAGLITATGNIQAGNFRTAGLISSTGAITTGGDISITGNIVDGAALTIITSSNGNITLAPNGTGVVVTNTDIRNGQASGTGNIGASGATFNTIFARATSAQYADLAENYQADKELDYGQVVEFGGTEEICQTTSSHSTRVAGVISTKPSYLMNAELQGQFVYAVALTGRVPCYVVGNIKKGDLLVSSDIRAVATVLDSAQYQPGCVIGKALENYNSQDIGKIEIAVGRF